MKDEHAAAINELVLQYCTAAGILPENHGVEAEVKFVPIESDCGPVPPEILDLTFMDRFELWVDQNIQGGGNKTVWRSFRTRISNVFSNWIRYMNAGQVGQTVSLDTLTFRMVVGTPVSVLLEFRNFGTKNLESVNLFLRTVHPGLKFGCASGTSVSGSELAVIERPPTLADLIAMRLDE